ncbi:MAG: bifunctional [glutamine synthetase] adenylyltransferase/[glutamine synthetase]-adenylyl-L-tyrosine phosphorylase, partial [Methylocystis sp.]
RQIHAHKGHGEIAIEGHDVKLGRGGIREIEFFVQTQQLIVGGRDRSLRGRATLDMLERLAKREWIEDSARAELTEAYLFLRDVEHRVQMIADEQKHVLPASPAGVTVIADMMGFGGHDDFASALRRRLETVQGHYARLFERAPRLSSPTGNLVFTGDEDDPATLETLERLGFAHPKTVTESVRGWHFGRFPATRSTTARERLTELTPALLEALAAAGDADRAFLAFDRFLGHLPAGVQLFSLLVAHPRLLELVAKIMGAAPKLAFTLARRPRVLGALLEPAFYKDTPGAEDLSARLAAQFAEAHSYEDELDRARIFGQEQKFLIGVRLLTRALSAQEAGRAYAQLAEVLIAGLLERVEVEFARAHGRVPGGAAAVVALGKLGGREMTAASDLDLMLLYDADPLSESVGGERRLPALQYYARLTQRLIAALSAPTAEGLLYDVDFRLRPSGNKGPIAIRLEAFDDYQINEAWTWEHMALTRARVVAGPEGFASRVNASIRAVLARPCAKMRVREDVLSMRRLIEKEKPAEGPWNIKYVAGGQVDVEFITQYLLLIHGAEGPRCLSTSTVEALRNLARDHFLDEAAARELIDATLLYQTITQIQRLAIDDDFVPEKASRGLRGLLASAVEAQDIQQVEQLLTRTQRRVREVFATLLDERRN